MKKHSFLIIVLATLACMLLLDNLAPQPLVSHDSNLVYAMGRHHGGNHGGGSGNNGGGSGNTHSVPEPATIILLGASLLGLAGLKNFFKK